MRNYRLFGPRLFRFMIYPRTLLITLVFSAALIGLTGISGAQIENPVKVPSGPIFGACSDIKNNAEAMSCVKTRRDRAQEDLNALFKRITRNLSDEKLAELREAQKSWVRYRQNQCGLEASLAGGKAGKTLYYRACEAELTKQRINVLDSLLSWQKTPESRAYGEFPRWLNILTEAKPDVVWDGKNTVEADLDCDGVKDRVVTGVIFNPEHNTESEKDEGTGKPHELRLKLALFHDQSSGHKSPVFFEIPMTVPQAQNKSATSRESQARNEAQSPSSPAKTDHDVSVCSLKPELVILRHSTSSAQTRRGSAPPKPERTPRGACVHGIQFKDPVCPSFFLRLVDGKFQIESQKGQ